MRSDPFSHNYKTVYTEYLQVTCILYIQCNSSNIMYRYSTMYSCTCTCTLYHIHMHSTHLSVMVSRVLCNRPSQLSHLDLSLVVPLKAGEQDLPLTWFQTVHHASNGALIVHVREENEFLVDEIRVGDVTGSLSIKE